VPNNQNKENKKGELKKRIFVPRGNLSGEKKNIGNKTQLIEGGKFKKREQKKKKAEQQGVVKGEGLLTGQNF